MHLVGLARWAKQDPLILDESRVRDYLLYLRIDRKYAPSSMHQAIAALRAFYRDLHKHSWDLWSQVKVRRTTKLPVVLTRSEVQLLLNSLERLRFRVALGLIYHCGLRVGEALRIELKDIDAALGRIHLRHTKGGKDRYVPVSPGMIQELRAFWKMHRNPCWIFPGMERGWKFQKEGAAAIAGRCNHPMSEESIQNALRLALRKSQITKHVVVHTLRHSYATHLLEEGVSIRLISQYLGHTSLDTTLIYTHLTAVSEEKTREALERLHAPMIRKSSR